MAAEKYEAAVMKLRQDKTNEFFQAWKSAKQNAKRDVINIVTTEKNVSTGAVMCRGKMVVSVDGWGEASKDNIICRIEKTTKGKNYMTVYDGTPSLF